jgi:succinate dehydrogenase / fumarate reductase cytochrome b subunit
LHRLAGLGILLFLYLHVFDIWLLGLGEDVFNRFLFLYQAPPFKVLEVFLIFGVLFHAVNGARIIIVDFVPGATRHQKRLVWIETVIMLAVLIPATWVTLAPLFE